MVENNKLRLLQNFVIDRTLPKYGEKTNNNFVIENNNFIGEGILISNEGEMRFRKNEKKTKRFNLKRFFKRPNKKKIVFTIEQFFKQSLDSIEALTPMKDVIHHYDTLVSNAEKTGQLALIEKIKDKLEIIRLEAKLLETKFTKFIKEDSIVKYFNIVPNKEFLHFSWIKNYARVIPDDVIKVKEKADELKVFDNYGVLYFSTEKNPDLLTKEEKRKAADPILFGLIKDSNKLYYIADWVDDVCDLTLDKLLETIDEKTFEVTNRSVKTVCDD